MFKKRLVEPTDIVDGTPHIHTSFNEIDQIAIEEGVSLAVLYPIQVIRSVDVDEIDDPVTYIRLCIAERAIRPLPRVLRLTAMPCNVGTQVLGKRRRHPLVVIVRLLERMQFPFDPIPAMIFL